MPKDFDLNSQKWLALVFADKNREYGAYVHREESSDRHLKALLIITLIALCLIFLPKLVKTIMPGGEKILSQTTIVDLANLADQEIPEENQVKEVFVPPPPELKATVQFTPPVIVDDSELKDDDVMMTQQDLTESTAAISVATIEGSAEGTVDIADLKDHKVITEVEQKPAVFHHVEVMPSFPGGDVALMKWLKENIVYPTIASEQGISGRVSLRFVVQPDGSIADVEVVKGLDPSCDREAVRAVKKMPKWIPGRQNGNPVYVYYNLPVLFQLQN